MASTSLNSWCWRWNHCSVSATFLLILLIVFASTAAFYGSSSSNNRPVWGCQDDSEGSWSIGVFYGDSPFSLKSIESMNVEKNDSSAWPVANPVVTCASLTAAGFPSNFVADPFLYLQGDILYLFYETKNSITLQGDIAVSKSVDKGVTWQHLGITLDEEWHLSYPYVFDYHDQIYMMPEGSKKGELRLYRAIKFPFQWTLDKVILKKPLVDSFIVNHNGNYWLFGSDHSGFGARKNGQLEIWYSNSPLGPWKPHKKNPIHNTNKSMGARNGGRPFVYNGSLYRTGQDCGETYGRRLHTFKVEILTEDNYKEFEVDLGLEESRKGRNSWNGARYHHLDVQRLNSGDWIGVMDGDRVPSGDSVRRFYLGCAALTISAALVILVGVLLGGMTCNLHLSWWSHSPANRIDIFSVWERLYLLSSKLRLFCIQMNRKISFIRGKMNPNTCPGRLVLALIFVTGIALMCTGFRYIYGGNGAVEPYPWKGHYSQFTLLVMTYEARLWNVRNYVTHYSKCSSVKEIVLVWNKGKPPKQSDLESLVPVRIRVEKQNSLNNRFKVDPLISTRAVLELDDYTMMTCDDIERGFRVWREHPDRIVGFYPRLIEGSLLKYRDEKYGRAHGGYNVILTGGAFIDHELAFKRYRSEEAKQGREMVDKHFNCEDILLNFLYANTSSSRTVDYVRPAWAIDTPKLSGGAKTRNSLVNYRVKRECILKFSQMYGDIANRRSEFDARNDHWDQ